MTGFLPLSNDDLQSPAGATKLNTMLQTLFNNAPGDGVLIADFTGYGSPNSALSANIGATYRQIDGTASTSFWVKTTNLVNTGWVALQAGLVVPVSTLNGGTGADFSAGVTGNILIFTGTGVLGQVFPTWAPNNIQVFTTTGTWTKPTGVSSAYVKVWGDGGGGGAMGGAGTAGGGGAGGYSEGITAVTGNVTVTVGAGGAGGAAGSNNGNAGSGSSFAGTTTISASGGGLGTNAGTGGTGGAGSNGQINLTGMDGNFYATGTGGQSYGFYYTPVPTTSSNGKNGANYGNGGSGAFRSGAGNSAGGNGATGLVIVYY